MLKKFFSVLLIFSFIFLISGCNDNSNNEELEEFDVILDWYPNAVHSYIYEAIEKGYYEEEGLKVNIRFPANTNDAISLTAAGKADVGIYYMHDLILAKAKQNIPVKSIGTAVQKPLDVFLSLKEMNITEPKDLIGKTIGQAGTDLSEAVIKFVVEKAGGSVDDVDIIDVGFDLMNSMTTGNVDATIGCLINHEVPQMEEEGFEVNYFFPNEYGMPDYYGFVFVTGDEQIKNKSEKLKKFLRASKKGFEDMKNNPDEAIKILLENQNAENFPLNENVEKKSIEILIPKMELENSPFLSQNEDIWQNNINWLYEEKFINEQLNAKDFFVDLL